MARRRMISAELMRSDEFLALPAQSQLLYVHLLVEADDDGFLLGKNRIITMLGLDESAFTALTDAGFVLRFSTGAAVITHWPVCNAIRKDRHTPTKYRAELAQLECVPEVGYVLKQEPHAVQKEEIFVQKEEPVVQTEEPVVQKIEPDVQKDEPAVQTEKPVVQTEALAEAEASPAASGRKEITAKETAAENQDAGFQTREFCPYAPPLPLASGGELRLLQKDVDVWRRRFPDVNVTEEFRKLREYLGERPDKRKTADETWQYAEKWLSRAQDKTAQKGGKKKHMPDESPPSYDIDLAEYLMNTRVPKLTKRQR